MERKSPAKSHPRTARSIQRQTRIIVFCFDPNQKRVLGRSILLRSLALLIFLCFSGCPDTRPVTPAALPNDLPEDGTLCNLENPCPANRRCDNGICVDDVGNDAGVNTNPSEDGGSGEVAMQDGGSTTQVNDGGPTASSDAGIPNEPRVIGADITEPVHLTSHPVGDALIFTGQISDSLNSYDDILVEWTSDADGLLH